MNPNALVFTTQSPASRNFIRMNPSQVSSWIPNSLCEKLNLFLNNHLLTTNDEASGASEYIERDNGIHQKRFVSEKDFQAFYHLLFQFLFQIKIPHFDQEIYYINNLLLSFPVTNLLRIPIFHMKHLVKVGNRSDNLYYFY